MESSPVPCPRPEGPAIGASVARPAPGPLPAAATGGRLRELDGLRGLAILLVLVWHYLVVGNQATPDSAQHLFNRVFSLSWAGVDLFFVLSGFLIGGILIDRRGSDDYFSRFWRRRVARLAPLYLIVIGLYAVGRPAGQFLYPGQQLWVFDNAGKVPLWSYLLYVQNFYMASINNFGPNWLSATWSLAVEEQFYLLAPLLLRFVPLRLLPGILVALAAGPLVWRNIYLGAGGSPVGAYVLLPNRWEGLLVGILVAYYYRQPAMRAWLATHQSWLMAGLAVAMCGLAGFVLAHQSLHSPAMMTLGYSYLPLVAALLLLVALGVNWPLVKGLFTNRALAELGVISYGVYLLHQPIHGLASWVLLGKPPELVTAGDGLVALACLALTLALARLSWRHIEKPVIDLAHRPVAKPAGWLSLLPAPLRQPSR